MTTSNKVTSSEQEFDIDKEEAIRQVVDQQTGTLAKALLEGVMNAEDAGASEVHVNITAGTASVNDNGKGFQTREDILLNFQTFCRPHDRDEEGFSTDAKHGRFRIGRGQMFRFGYNVWRTNEFLMEVDVKKKRKELGYTKYVLESGHSPRHGCRVEIELYQTLSPRDIKETVRELTKYVLYAGFKVFVNGKQVNVDPARRTWDVDTEDVYISKQNAERWERSGLDFYHGGIFVQTLDSQDYGLKGTVVAKLPVKVNQARNMIIQDCSRWKRIKKFLKQEGVNDAKRKKRLSQMEAANFVAEYAGGEGTVSFRAFSETACLLDTNGKMWSPQQIVKLLHTRGKRPAVRRDPLGNIHLSFAERGSKLADRAIQAKKAVVLSTAIFEQLNVLDEYETREELWEGVLDILSGKAYDNNDRFEGRVKLCYDLKALLSDKRAEYHLFDELDYTGREQDFVAVMENIMWSLDRASYSSYQDRERRTVLIGESALATAWTDGEGYVAFDRSWVGDLKLHMERDWCKAVQSLIHCFCHKESDQCSHTHTIEWYQDFTDLSENLPDWARKCYQTYKTRVLRRAGKLPQSVVDRINSDAEVHAAEMHAYLDAKAKQPETETSGLN